MNGTVFNIGVTTCGFTMATLVEHHPNNIIGTFWLPSTVEDYQEINSKWIDYVLDISKIVSFCDKRTLKSDFGTGA